MDQKFGTARKPDQPLRDHLAYLASRSGNAVWYLAEDTLALLDRLEAAEARIAVLEASAG